jgi:hypothetical protein
MPGTERIPEPQRAHQEQCWRQLWALLLRPPRVKPDESPRRQPPLADRRPVPGAVRTK